MEIYKINEFGPLEELCWSSLAWNEHENAINFMEQNIDKINWDNLSKNPNAIHILEKNKDKIKEQGTTYLKKLKEENPEKLKEYRRTYYLKKKEKMKEEN